jgi:hypothetical protein
MSSVSVPQEINREAEQEGSQSQCSQSQCSEPSKPVFCAEIPYDLQQGHYDRQQGHYDLQQGRLHTVIPYENVARIDCADLSGEITGNMFLVTFYLKQTACGETANQGFKLNRKDAVKLLNEFRDYYSYRGTVNKDN